MDVCLILIIQGFFIYNNLICIKIDGKKKDEWGCKERRTESLCQAGSLPEDIISNITWKGFIKLVHHFYVVCLLDCEQFFTSKICKLEYLGSEVARVVRAQIRIRCSNTLLWLLIRHVWNATFEPRLIYALVTAWFLWLTLVCKWTINKKWAERDCIILTEQEKENTHLDNKPSIR